jgi:hypothetical protein
MVRMPPSTSGLDPIFLVAVAGLLVAVVGLAIGVAGLLRARATEERYRLLMEGVDGADLAAALDALAGRQRALDTLVASAQQRLEDVDRRLRTAIQHVTVSRYRAFEDAGGDQSFTVALLDDADNGVVMTGLHSRAGVRVYAKPLQGGRSPYALTSEEVQAVEKVSAPDPAGR